MKRAIQEHASLYSPANTRSQKVAIYARVSMPSEGEDPRAQHPENQLRILRREAEDLGLEVYHEYIDRASGADLKRKGIEQLLRDARGHRFSLVLTTKVDRFARSVKHLLHLLEELKDYGVAVRFTQDSAASTDTPQAEFTLQILAAAAQFERSMISTRTKDGIDRYISEKGHWGPKGRQDISSKEVRRLKDEEKLSIREISRRLGVSVGTVHGRLRSEKGRVDFPKGEASKKRDSEKGRSLNTRRPADSE